MIRRSVASAGDARRPPEARLAGWLLLLAALLGAASGVLAARDGAAGSAELPPGVAALVDDRPILSEDFERAFEMFAGDRREPPSQRDRARVLDRLIDEELLVASALADGLLASERSVRDAVTLAIVESVVAESASRAPTQDELRAAFDSVRAAAGNPAAAEPFEAMREPLEAVVSLRARDLALRAYLKELRERARIGCSEGAVP